MKISPDNPHLRSLRNLLIDESLGKAPIRNNSLLGLGDDEIGDIIASFAFLDENEKRDVIERIVKAYFAREISRKLMQNITTKK